MKDRLDRALVARGLAESRTQAQALVLAGKVFSGTRRLDKAGLAVGPDMALEVRGPAHPWVSRGGLKLARGLEAFAVPVRGRACLDIGASTGGFTDVLLANGAARVWAVDVGRGQLAWKLRSDDRVRVMEGVNARYLTAADIPDPVDLVVCDASFISLATILPAPLALTRPGAHLVALIKPQFGRARVGKGGVVRDPAGRARVGKGGVVRDPETRREVCDAVHAWLEGRDGWSVLGLEESPVRGPQGNVEYLIAAVRA